MKPRYKFIDLSTGEIAQGIALVDADGNQITFSNDSPLLVKIVNPDGSQVDVPAPLSTEDFKIHAKDIDEARSDLYNFSGQISELFDNLTTDSIDNTANNPKQLKLAFNSTLYFSEIGLGCNDNTGFSQHITIQLLGSNDVVRETVESTTGSLNSRLIQFSSNAANGIIITFETADPVCISNITFREIINTESVIKALKPDGILVYLTATESGNLKVANVEDGLSISSGDVMGTASIAKFGKAPDFDISDGYVSVWDGADNINIGQMRYIYSTAAIIDSLSSTNIADTQPIEVQGLDANYNIVLQTITLNGQNRVPFTTNLLRVFRMKNVGTVDTLGFVSCYENTAISGGFPIDRTKIKAVISEISR